MKVQVEKKPESVSTLKIELPPDEVSKEWDTIANSFAKFAKIPGYRPGKAPRAVIDKRFRKEIQDEVTKKVVAKSYREAIEQKKLRVASLTNVEQVQFGDDKSLRFEATIVTAPEFKLPDYKNISVELPDTKVTEEEIAATLERLREQTADFVDAPDRAAQMEDFAVIDFEGTVEGKPVSEVAPNASKNLQGGKKFWLHLAADNFMPKFCEQIVGQKKEETRTVIVDLPSDFAIKELAGKKASYSVTLREIKEKVLPEANDEFAAKLLPGKSLADLRHQIEHDLEHEKEHQLERAKEEQVIKYLQEKTKFDVPPPLLRNETKRALTELVQRNRARGIPDEMLKEKEKELIETAASVAHHRLKTNFILERIAEQEKIEVTREDVDLRVRQEAHRYDISVDKMRKELEEHDQLNALAEQVLLGKVLDFLKANVSVQAVSESEKK
ncbi:MAG TPA: trigger factor [Chthoniobacterales bacterium]|jgi:trigger factor|nr:trigger factor [Chthoniobacterales bacterium]